jgi:hypothetical protein
MFFVSVISTAFGFLIYIEVTDRSPMIISFSVDWQEREAVSESDVNMAQQQCHD